MVEKKIYKTKRNLKGLHRPFNKPLKSLYWVCRFAKKHSIENASAFYVSFYLYHLRYISSSDEQYENLLQNEGMISPKDARRVLAIQRGCSSQFLQRINSVLYERKDGDDRLLYKTYKNASYYISLSKKMGLLTPNYQVSCDGNRLLASTNKMYILTSAEKELYFEWILDANFELFVTLLLEHSKNSLIYQRFLEQHGYGRSITKFVRSYDKNYVEVLRSWIVQLDILTKRGKIRDRYMQQLERLGYLQRYYDLANKFDVYTCSVEKGRSMQERAYARFDEAYKTLVKNGIVDAGYVNLYDIKAILRMSYERFNVLLSDYYTNRKFNQIILFSNTVSSIDTRQRFVVESQVVLKVKLIKKKKVNGTK